MIVIFTLATGRSGTRFLSGLLRHNVKDAVCKHEPYFSPSNPTMFGLPIFQYMRGDLEPIRAAVRKKQQRILRYQAAAYIETSHAFLKSYADVAIEFFPEMKLVHLIRNPLKTAQRDKSRIASKQSSLSVSHLSRSRRRPLFSLGTYRQGTDLRQLCRHAADSISEICRAVDRN